MNDTIPFSDLEIWSDNHRSNLDKLPFRSQSAAISLKELKNFIKKAEETHKARVDSFKIYFVRYEFEAGAPETRITKAEAGSNLSQVSLIFVPSKIINREDWTVEDLKDPADISKILALYVCKPDSDPVTDETGLCPPNSGCPKSSFGKG